MKLRFAMIEVKKSQGALSKSKAADVNITNEIKIITASDEVYELWKEVISRQSQGLLLDPESMKPLRDVRSWDPENDGVLKREFFKHLGNTAEYDLKRLALHLLNRMPKRTLLHPKVMMKKCNFVIVDCYSAKEWLECNKRKQAMRKYLYLEKCGLGFFDTKGVYRREKWKVFKVNFNITRATKQLLLTAPTESFFSLAKRPSMKNKTAKDLSPYAAEFFKVFLKSKGEYETPEANIFVRPYDTKEDTLATWGNGVWEPENVVIKLALLDFRNISRVINKETALKESPYFEEFMGEILRLTDPAPTDPEVWFWICGNEDVEDDLRIFMRSNVFGTAYEVTNAEYIPALVEQLEDVSVGSSKARAPVRLMFLTKKGAKLKTKKIPRRYEAPNLLKWMKPGLYTELDYRIYNMELRMEFYIRIMELFCDARSNVLSVFVGGKIVCESWVSKLLH